MEVGANAPAIPRLSAAPAVGLTTVQARPGADLINAGTGKLESATYELLQLLRVARALDRKCCKGALDFEQLVGVQFDVGGANVLFETK